MNDNIITFRLCDEDRARLDKIIEGLACIGQRPDCSKCAHDVANVVEKACEVIDSQPKPQDEVDKALSKVLTDHGLSTAKNAQEAPETSTPPSIPEKEKQPTVEAPAPEASEKTVNAAELQHLVIALCKAGKKDKVREVISAYGVQTVAAIPEDKRAEVYARLKTLEG